MRYFAACIFLASVAVAPYLLALFARAVRYTHVYLASILTHCKACSLCFDIQEVTLLLGKYTLFARANLCFPTTRLQSYFPTIFAAQLCVYTRMMGCKRSLMLSFIYIFSAYVSCEVFLLYIFSNNICSTIMCVYTYDGM